MSKFFQTEEYLQCSQCMSKILKKETTCAVEKKSNERFLEQPRQVMYTCASCGEQVAIINAEKVVHR